MEGHFPQQAGRRGERVRGDVWMGYAPGQQSLDIQLTSKLEGMYGERTREFLAELCAETDLKTGILEVEDKGAYPFILRARLEALWRKVAENPHLQLAPEPPLEGAVRASDPQRNRARRSRLYLPGNEAKYMLNAALYEPDAVILDLEDSVAPPSKEDARSLVRHALHFLPLGNCERMVRINQGSAGLEDLQALGDAPFEMVLIPKVEDPETIAEVAAAAPDRLLMPIIESARGVLQAQALGGSHPQVAALTLGLEDLTADLGVAKTPQGSETHLARSWVVLAAKAHGLQAIDSVYGDIADEAGLRSSVQEAKAMGFEGKGCVHPRQIRTIHEEFAPSAEELEQAQKIVAAFEEAQKEGLGVVALGSKMIDPPVVQRALNLVRQHNSSA